MKRRKVSKRGSKRLFTKTGSTTHKVNLRMDSMRGGIRM